MINVLYKAKLCGNRSNVRGMCTWLSRHFKSWPYCCEDIAEGYFYLRHHYHFSPELLQQNPLTPFLFHTTKDVKQDVLDFFPSGLT